MFIDPVIETVFIEHTVCQTGGGKTCAFKELALQHLQYIGGNKMHFREAVQCVQQKE